MYWRRQNKQTNPQWNIHNHLHLKKHDILWKYPWFTLLRNFELFCTTGKNHLLFTATKAAPPEVLLTTSVMTCRWTFILKRWIKKISVLKLISTSMSVLYTIGVCLTLYTASSLSRLKLMHKLRGLIIWKMSNKLLAKHPPLNHSTKATPHWIGPLKPYPINHFNQFQAPGYCGSSSVTNNKPFIGIAIQNLG